MAEGSFARRIEDPSFRAAVAALQSGDLAALTALIDREPRLLRERIRVREENGRDGFSGYFRDPKLFWFVANNPILMDPMPATIGTLAAALIERGVDRTDLDYTLGLVMSGAAAREAGLQTPLVRQLLAAGAVASREAIVSTAAHRETGILRVLLDDGFPETLEIASALGDVERARAWLATADADAVQVAFALAVINRHVDIARLAIDAGAPINAYLAVHAHSTALHQAAENDDGAMITLLRERGADETLPDTLFGGTPLGWAIHSERPAARAMLERPMPRAR